MKGRCTVPKFIALLRCTPGSWIGTTILIRQLSPDGISYDLKSFFVTGMFTSHPTELLVKLHVLLNLMIYGSICLIFASLELHGFQSQIKKQRAEIKNPRGKAHRFLTLPNERPLQPVKSFFWWVSCRHCFFKPTWTYPNQTWPTKKTNDDTTILVQMHHWFLEWKLCWGVCIWCAHSRALDHLDGWVTRDLSTSQCWKMEPQKKNKVPLTKENKACLVLDEWAKSAISETHR